jgi:hypothetical protein
MRHKTARMLVCFALGILFSLIFVQQSIGTPNCRLTCVQRYYFSYDVTANTCWRYWHSDCYYCVHYGCNVLVDTALVCEEDTLTEQRYKDGVGSPVCPDSYSESSTCKTNLYQEYTVDGFRYHCTSGPTD